VSPVLGQRALHCGRYQEAEKEYRIAAKLDPTASAPHNSIGHIREVEKNYDDALDEYRKAQELDGNDASAYTDAGRILLLKKEFPAAIAELKRAEELDPTSSTSYDLRGQAFERSGDRDAAITEYKEALSIAPKELQHDWTSLSPRKKGDWVAALDNYRRAALDENAAPSAVFLSLTSTPGTNIKALSNASSNASLTFAARANPRSRCSRSSVARQRSDTQLDENSMPLCKPQRRP